MAGTRIAATTPPLFCTKHMSHNGGSTAAVCPSYANKNPYCPALVGCAGGTPGEVFLPVAEVDFLV